jgi:hypothetical protein
VGDSANVDGIVLYQFDVVINTNDASTDIAVSS